MSRIFDRYLSKARGILDSNWTESYTKPSPALYPHQWNWDIGFIAIGKAHYDTPGAVAELKALFSAQWAKGMLPQIVFNPSALGHYFPEPDFWQTDSSPNRPEGKLTSGITMPPIHAVAATREQADTLYQRLDSFSFCALHQGNCYTIPNYDTRAEDFDRANYWRGPVWININWMLADGLARYGYTLKADSLRRDLLQLPIRFGFYEYFDSFTGKGF